MGRLRQVFDRYAGLHLSLEKPGFPLVDEVGTSLGQIDRLRLVGNRLFLEGWTRADRISATLNGTTLEVVPDIRRPDVAAALADEGLTYTGFVVEFPDQEGPITFCVMMNELRYVYQLDGFDAQDRSRARQRLYRPFLRAALNATPPALRWFLFRDSLARAAVKNRLGLQVPDVSGRLANALFDDWSFGDQRVREVGAEEARVLAECPPDTEITIVLPVYNAFDLLPEVLDRVLRHTDLPWRLVMIEDCSSDDRVRPFLHQWIADLAPEMARHVHLIENPENRGFIRSVNSAFDVARDLGNHVVLLNSDAFVPAGWASRLLRPLFAHENVATVTPMSNDAEIFTAPVICQREILAPGLADRVDDFARTLNPDAALADAPTGVGFCMAMHLKYLKLETHFDVSFGRGYGEEVDWCQRVRQRGARHLGTGHLFVEHRVGSSFGSEEKLKLVLANNAVIARRYPDYDREVQDFIQHDPLATPRLALAVAYAAGRARSALPIYMGSVPAECRMTP